MLPLLGIPFRTGGRTGAGMDCLGLVAAGLASLGIPWQDPWERVSVAWQRGERPIADAEPPGWDRLPGDAPLQRGDIVLSRNAAGVPQHVSLALGPRDILHTTEGTGSIISRARTLRGKIEAVYRWRPT